MKSSIGYVVVINAEVVRNRLLQNSFLGWNFNGTVQLGQYGVDEGVWSLTAAYWEITVYRSNADENLSHAELQRVDWLTFTDLKWLHQMTRRHVPENIN